MLLNNMEPKQTIYVASPQIPKCCPTCGRKIIWENKNVGECSLPTCAHIKWNQASKDVTIQYEGGPKYVLTENND